MYKSQPYENCSQNVKPSPSEVQIHTDFRASQEALWWPLCNAHVNGAYQLIEKLILELGLWLNVLSKLPTTQSSLVSIPMIHSFPLAPELVLKDRWYKWNNSWCQGWQFHSAQDKHPPIRTIQQRVLRCTMHQQWKHQKTLMWPMCNPLAYRLTQCLKKAGMQKWQFNAKNEI